jgi:hypothetical protein
VVAATSPITYNSSTQTVGINQTSITALGTVTTVTSPSTAGSAGVRKTYISTSDPSGGANGDVWLKYS